MPLGGCSGPSFVHHAYMSDEQVKESAAPAQCALAPARNGQSAVWHRNALLCIGAGP